MAALADDQRCARSLKPDDRSMPSICLTRVVEPILAELLVLDLLEYSVYFRNQVATSEWASMILPFNDAEPGSLVEQSGRRSVPPARD